MSPEPLPLFALQVVLLPGEPLPLHIFEERYKQMIGECLEEEAPFGVVLAEVRGARQVGCTALIEEVIEKFSDGRMNILTRGERRFRILRTSQDRPYTSGEVEYFEDAHEPPSYDLAGRLLTALGERTVKGLALPEEVRKDPARLSFVLGAALKLTLAKKQELLESTSARERLNLILKALEEEGEQSARREEQKKSAARNGHP
ncbi:MAG: LON peptidase substrate-binding domain-containing protein [bacterium]